MNKTKKLSIVSGVLIAVGVLFWGIGTAMGGTTGFTVDRLGLHSRAKMDGDTKPHMLEKTKLDSFENFDISCVDTNLNVIPSDGYYLEYRVHGNLKKPTYSVSNNNFNLRASGSGSYGTLEFFNVSLPSFEEEDYYVNLYVPADAAFKTAKLSGDYGNISLPALKANSMDFTLSDGDFTCDSLQADSLDFNSDYGDITIDLFNCNTSKIVMSDGDFNGTLGKITTLDLKSDYGDVTLKLADKLDTYHTDLRAEYGKISLPEHEESIQDEDDEEIYRSKGDSAQSISLDCTDGDIRLME